MIINALEAISWMLGAAVISYPLANVILRSGAQPRPRHKGGNR